jgi:hypothetical protein
VIYRIATADSFRDTHKDTNQTGKGTGYFLQNAKSSQSPTNPISFLRPLRNSGSFAFAQDKLCGQLSEAKNSFYVALVPFVAKFLLRFGCGFAALNSLRSISNLV